MIRCRCSILPADGVSERQSDRVMDIYHLRYLAAIGIFQHSRVHDDAHFRFPVSGFHEETPL